MGKLDGKVAFVTGAARGQGRSHAVRLATEGADIVAVDVCEQIDGIPYPLPTEADLKETARLVEDTGRGIVSRVADVRSRPDLQAAFDAGVEAFGHVDIVLANAGVVLAGNPDADDDAMFQLGLDILLTGVWNTFQVAAPHLRERQSGVIVATSSTAGLKGFTDGSGAADAYTCAKTAIVGLVRSYAALLGPHNVRVNAIAPTGVATPMVLENPGLFDIITEFPHLQGVMANALPVEMLQPEDISAVVAFLVSDEGRYITGSTVAIDAGSLIR